MSSFQLKAIELNNWISYYGDNRLDFSGPRGNNSFILYGEDSRGKTAFFESFHFAFFGRVVKRQKGMKAKSKEKPYFSSMKKNEPLMNAL